MVPKKCSWQFFVTLFWDRENVTLAKVVGGLQLYIKQTGHFESPGSCWLTIFSHQTKTRWWFQIFFIFFPTWENDPIWLICFYLGWNHHVVSHQIPPKIKHIKHQVILALGLPLPHRASPIFIRATLATCTVSSRCWPNTHGHNGQNERSCRNGKNERDTIR